MELSEDKSMSNGQYSDRIVRNRVNFFYRLCFYFSAAIIMQAIVN